MVGVVLVGVGGVLEVGGSRGILGGLPLPGLAVAGPEEGAESEVTSEVVLLWK